MSKSLAFVGGVIFAMAALPAAAVTVITDKVAFDPALALVDPTSSANFQTNVTGDDTGAPRGLRRRTPWNEVVGAEDSAYSSVGMGGFAEYSFPMDQTRFEMMWGSPDEYNTLTFFNDGAEVFSIMGNDPIIEATPSFSTLGGFVRIQISDITFDSFLLETDFDAFEYVFTTPIPTPAAFSMLLTGLAGVVVLRRRANA